MKITRCKLLRKQQLKLLEYFVLEVTARSAADILDIQPNTAMLFYRKIRQVISHHVELQATEILMVHRMLGSVLGVLVKANGAGVLLVRWSYLEY